MSVKYDFDVAGFWIIFFFLFWMQAGWYRVDCALGEAKACALITAEYAKKPQP